MTLVLRFTKKQIIMKKISSLFLILAASFASMSFTGPLPAAGHTWQPLTLKVAWADEAHDFGTIPQGKPVSHAFSFTNTGDEPVIIAEVHTSCGCTASDYTKEPIAPGKTSTIKVTFNANAKGAFNKTVTVDFQDASLKKVLNIKGTVE